MSSPMRKLRNTARRYHATKSQPLWPSLYRIYGQYTGGYTRVTSGSTCTRITSKADCEEAARQLGFSDTSANEENESSWPPYCYGYGGSTIYFNLNANAVSDCDSDNRICFCKDTTGKMEYMNELPPCCTE